VSLAHGPPTGLSWQVPLAQLLVQQSSLMVHDWPADLVHAHCIPPRSGMHCPLQQGSVAHVAPSTTQQAALMQVSPAPQAGEHAAVERHLSPDGTYPWSQAMPHLVPSQVAWPCAGAGQGVQLVPHVATLSLRTHSLMPHSWKPSLQLMPHLPPVQVALPLAGTRHGLHEPQCSGSVCASTHRWPHRSGVGATQPAHWYAAPTRRHAGVLPLQTVWQSPQCSNVVSAVSQPGSGVQSPKSGRHAPVRSHAPPLQVTFAGSTLGSVVQSWLQAPQWRGSTSSRVRSQGPLPSLPPVPPSVAPSLASSVAPPASAGVIGAPSPPLPK
jgi:hypothetical protein